MIVGFVREEVKGRLTRCLSRCQIGYATGEIVRGGLQRGNVLHRRHSLTKCRTAVVFMVNNLSRESAAVVQ